MDFVKKYAYVFLGVVCVLALGGLFLASRDRPAGVMDLGHTIGEVRQNATPPPQDVYTGPGATNYQPYVPDIPATIYVHVVGAVYDEGVVEVPYGSRVFHVVEMAGGHTSYADLSLINLVAEVHDGMQIRIPFYGEEPQEVQQGAPATATGQAGITADGRVNINLANLTELQTLPNIGPSRAENIINFRDTNGGFNSIEELVNVPLIGATILDNIRDRITV